MKAIPGFGNSVLWQVSSLFMSYQAYYLWFFWYLVVVFIVCAAETTVKEPGTGRKESLGENMKKSKSDMHRGGQSVKWKLKQSDRNMGCSVMKMMLKLHKTTLIIESHCIGLRKGFFQASLQLHSLKNYHLWSFFIHKSLQQWLLNFLQSKIPSVLL